MIVGTWTIRPVHVIHLPLNECIARLQFYSTQGHATHTLQNMMLDLSQKENK